MSINLAKVVVLVLMASSKRAVPQTAQAVLGGLGCVGASKRLPDMCCSRYVSCKAGTIVSLGLL